jgi:hypothetical protein
MQTRSSLTVARRDCTVASYRSPYGFSEYRFITAISGTMITLNVALYVDHSSGAAVAAGCALVMAFLNISSSLRSSYVPGFLAAPIGATQGIQESFTFQLPVCWYYEMTYANAVRQNTTFFGSVGT